MGTDMTDDWLTGANRGGFDKPSPKQTSATAKSLTPAQELEKVLRQGIEARLKIWATVSPVPTYWRQADIIVSEVLAILKQDYIPRSEVAEAIGEDESELVGNNHMVSATTRNKLRAELRKKLNLEKSWSR